jgi:hypothetical protein
MDDNITTIRYTTLKENKCGNFGFYPRVMCTAKSVSENIGKS